jgi:hypothetical protein
MDDPPPLRLVVVKPRAFALVIFNIANEPKAGSAIVYGGDWFRKIGVKPDEVSEPFAAVIPASNEIGLGAKPREIW